MTTSSRTKCVILTTPLKWGSQIGSLHVNEATRGMHWGTVAKIYFKRLAAEIRSNIPQGLTFTYFRDGSW